jgi:bifunctional non-homologous end joining protein LigD
VSPFLCSFSGLPFPGFVEPAFATSIAKAPVGDRWIHEIKFDGYRVQVHLANTEVKVFTRNGHDWTERYPLIVEAALRNRVTSFVIDGEAVLLGVDGVSDFDGLHSVGMTPRCSSIPSQR